jgi:hypothetical protein
MKGTDYEKEVDSNLCASQYEQAKHTVTNQRLETLGTITGRHRCRQMVRRQMHRQNDGQAAVEQIAGENRREQNKPFSCMAIRQVRQDGIGLDEIV